MLGAMDHLDTLADKLVAEDRASQSEAVATLDDLRRMVRSVGGVKGLRASWGDADVERVNEAIASAYEVY